MKWLPGLVVMLPLAAGAGPADRNLQKCLTRADAAFEATRGDDLPDRRAALDRASTAESECMTFAILSCTLNGAGRDCLPELQSFLETDLRAATAQLPDGDAVPAPVSDMFARWSETNSTGRPLNAVPCAMVKDSGPAGCAALNTGSSLIETRNWLRVFRLFRDLQ